MWCWYFPNKPIAYLDAVASSFMSLGALKPLGLTWWLPAEMGGYCHTDHISRGDFSRNDLCVVKGKGDRPLLS